MKKLYVRVFHRGYGCETGCCGHAVEIKGVDDDFGFDFGHPGVYELSFKEYASKIAEDAIRKDHPECLDSIDWDTINYEDVSDD